MTSQGSCNTITIAGWSSQVARRAHNPKVDGSNPSPATKYRIQASEDRSQIFLSLLSVFCFLCAVKGGVAQLVRAAES